MSYKFIRGSQVSFHFMKMFAQSFKRMVWMSFSFMLLGCIIYLISNADSYPFRIDLMGNYIVSKLDSIFSLERDVSFTEYDGNIVKTSNTNFISWYENTILPKIIFFTKSSLVTGIKYFFGSFFATLLMFYFQGSLRAKDRMLRGKSIISDNLLKRRIIIDNIKRFDFFPYKIGGFAFPDETEFQHTIITGGSGTGKTQMISDLINQIRKKKGRAVIYDRSGSFIRKFYNDKKDIILNPYDLRSKNWDIFTEAANKNDFTNIVNALIEDSKSDPFWSKSAKTIMIEVINKLKQTKDNPTNKDLCDILLKYNLKDFCDFLKGTNASSIADESSEKTIASIRSVIGSYVNPLAILSEGQKNSSFSIKKWIEDYQSKDSILFLTSKIDSHQSIKPLLTVWFDIAILQLMNLDPEIDRKLWFIIDELPSLQQIPTLQTGLAESRKFGGAFIITCQLFSQLKEIYGQNISQSISGLCRNRVTFSTPDEETASWCSNNLGKKEHISTKENLSFGANEYRDGVNISQNKELEKLVIPSQIMNLKNLEFYISLSSGLPIAKSKVKYQDRIDIADRFLENIDISKFSETKKLKDDNVDADSKIFKNVKVHNNILKEKEDNSHDDNIIDIPEENPDLTFTEIQDANLDNENKEEEFEEEFDDKMSEDTSDESESLEDLESGNRP